jgi:hypothetical protein
MRGCCCGRGRVSGGVATRHTASSPTRKRADYLRVLRAGHCCCIWLQPMYVLPAACADPWARTHDSSQIELPCSVNLSPSRPLGISYWIPNPEESLYTGEIAIS